MKLHNIIQSHIAESVQLSKSLVSRTNEIFKNANILKKKIKNNKKIFIYGNGGSFSDGSHLAGELIATYKNRKRKALPVIMLSSNLTSLTAWSNDFNFNTYLEREIDALSNPGDVLILISTSGGNLKKKKSLNLINVAKLAKTKKIDVISFLGKNGGEIAKYSKIKFLSDSNKTPIIQENQQLIFHLLSEILDH